MNKKCKNTLAILAVTLCVTTTMNLHNVFASSSYKVDKNVNDIMDTLQEMEVNKDETARSSNPYIYIQNNKSYKEIVNLGPDALDTIRTKLKNSNNNGLKEYILAIAAEEISKVDLKGNTQNWSNGKEWLSEWDKLLVAIPDDVERITSSNCDITDKNEALSKLGVAAVPYILDKIEKGDAQYVPVVEKFIDTEEKQEIISKSKSYKSTDYTNWAKENKFKFANVKNAVEKVINEYK